MEIMVVIVLLALFSASALVGFGAVRRGRLKAGAAHLASAFRVGYVHALTTGRATRVVLDFNTSEVWLEDTEDAHVLDHPDPLRPGRTAQDLEAEAEADAERTLQARPRAPRAEFNRITNSRYGGARYAPRRVERDVAFHRLYTPHEAEPREEGRGYVYFFSGGVAERAVAQLRGADGAIFSVVLHPLNGRAEIFDHEVEPPPADDRGADDEDEVRDPGVVHRE
ncbi:MAG: hypothetical protein HY909_21940 [Deltaproteobacteria bacterium]|nr:hypothetical protein [Deltaproteobacteria bacterium]